MLRAQWRSVARRELCYAVLGTVATCQEVPQRRRKKRVPYGYHSLCFAQQVNMGVGARFARPHRLRCCHGAPNCVTRNTIPDPVT